MTLYTSTAEDDGTHSSLTVAIPGGAPGDYGLLVMEMAMNRSYTVPTGWTKILDTFNGTNLPLRVWAKTLDAGDFATGSVTVTGTQDAPWLLEMIVGHSDGQTALRAAGCNSPSGVATSVTGTTNTGAIVSPAIPQLGDTLIYIGAGYVGTVPPLNVSLNAGSALSSFTGTHIVNGSFLQLLVTDGVAGSSGNVSVTANGPTLYTIAAAVVALYPLPIINCNNPPEGTVGVPYTHTITSSGGVLPVTFSITGGSLPLGLTLNASTGKLSGTPTGNFATYSFTVTATDSASTPVSVSCSTTILISVDVIYTHLWRDDEFAANAYDQPWMNTASLPSPIAWSAAVTQPYTIQLLPPPGDQGELDLLVIAQGPPLNPLALPNGTPLGIPDNYFWAIKYGALADLLSQEGPGKDLQRAAYCEKRYQEAVQLCRAMPTVINGSVNEQSVQLDSVFDFDLFSPGWNNRGGIPEILGLAGQNILAVSSVPDPLVPVSIGIDVVVNAPIPQTDFDPILITADIAELILDESEHIASLKMGGQEFADSLRLHENFVKQASYYRSRSLVYQYWPPMSESDQLETVQNPVAR